MYVFNYDPTAEMNLIKRNQYSIYMSGFSKSYPEIPFRLQAKQLMLSLLIKDTDTNLYMHYRLFTGFCTRFNSI